MRVKICGITNLQDALDAISLGADAIGFIFAKSPRHVTIEKVKEITNQLPPFVTRVGVFVDQPLEEVNKTLVDCVLDTAQLHGKESVEYCKQVNRRVIKAFRIHDEKSLEHLKEYEDITASFLLDTFVPGMAGGTGQTFDWGLALKAKKMVKRPIILSGGINESNIMQAIKTVHPDGIDLSSGVEKSPGIKDYDKMRKLFSLLKKKA